MKINQYEMYAENSTEVEEALRELVTLPIKYVCEFLKLIILKLIS